MRDGAIADAQVLVKFTELELRVGKLEVDACAPLGIQAPALSMQGDALGEKPVAVSIQCLHLFRRFRR